MDGLDFDRLAYGLPLKRDDLAYPHYHWSIIECLQAFADPRRQAKWRLPPKWGDYDRLDTYVEALADDLHVLDGDNARWVGTYLRSPAEAKRLDEFVAVYRAVEADLGDEDDANKFFDHPGWAAVVRAAKRALNIMLEPDIL